MPYPASSVVLSDALQRANRIATQMKTMAQSFSAKVAAGNVGSGEILKAFTLLRAYRAELVRARDTPGIGPYAQEQLGDATLDVAAEFAAMLSAIDDTTAWIQSNFPKDGSGFLLAQTFGADRPQDRQFTPAQTAGFRAVLGALAATVS